MTGSMVPHAKAALTTAVQAFKRAKTATTQANLHRSHHAALPLFMTFMVLQLDSEGSDQKGQKQTGHLVPVVQISTFLGAFAFPTGPMVSFYFLSNLKSYRDKTCFASRHQNARFSQHLCIFKKH